MNLKGYPRSTRKWLAKVIASSLLALSLALSMADLFIPLFWDRRLLVRIGFILLATLVLAPFIPPTLSRFNRPPLATLPPVQRFFRLTLWLLVAGLMAGVIAGAARHSLQVAPIQEIAGYHDRQNPGLDLLSGTNHLEEVLFLSIFLLFFAVTKGDEEHLLTSSHQRAYTPLIFLGFCFLAGYFLNTLLPLIDTNSWLFHFPDMGFVPYSPAGGDFRSGLYESAQALLSGTYVPVQNQWPPLATALGLPYLLLSENKAYMVHVVVLIVSNVLCLSLAAVMAKDLAEVDSKSGRVNSQVLHVALFFLVLLSLFPSYPFLYSLERGKLDIIAMVFALASMYVLLKYPSRILLQVVLLSVAVQIKIYPAALFAVLYFVKRSKVILPSLLVNGCLLFVLGPANAFGFLEVMRDLGPMVWIENHSANAFARYLALDLDTGATELRLMEIFFTCLPVLIWLTAWHALVRFKNVGQVVLSGFMISVPLMDVFPIISLDYKSVILSCAALVCLSLILVRMRAQAGFVDYLQLLIVSIAVIFIGRSNTLMHEWPRFLQNKYPWVMLLEIAMLMSIFRQVRDGASETPAGSAPVQEPLVVKSGRMSTHC
jgi:hypothetical protein